MSTKFFRSLIGGMRAPSGTRPAIPLIASLKNFAPAAHRRCIHRFALGSQGYQSDNSEHAFTLMKGGLKNLTSERAEGKNSEGEGNRSPGFLVNEERFLASASLSVSFGSFGSSKRTILGRKVWMNFREIIIRFKKEYFGLKTPYFHAVKWGRFWKFAFAFFLCTALISLRSANSFYTQNL